MIIGVPLEIKNHEYRVAITPAGIQELVILGHQVVVETGAGLGSQFSDEDFRRAGARIVADATDVWSTSDLLLKVKEPIAAEYALLEEEQVLFTYLHLAASQECTEAILRSGATAIAYETVQLLDGTLPLLSPMSEVAGRLAAQVAAFYLMRPQGGGGSLMGGVPGTPRAQVVIIGGGVAGEHAAANAIGMGAEVTVIDKSLPRLGQLERLFGGRIHTRVSTHHEVARQVASADVVVGSVLVPGAQAPKLVTEEMVAAMRPGSVLVDIAIDQGGCFEGSRPTTHDDPIYSVHDSTFYCVANMPGSVPSTSTRALTNATLPYVIAIAQSGWKQALLNDPALAKGLSAHAGSVVSKPVATAFDLTPISLEEALS